LIRPARAILSRWIAGVHREQKRIAEAHLRKGIIYGSAVASFCCEGFGLSRTTRVTKKQIEERFSELERMAKF